MDFTDILLLPVYLIFFYLLAMYIKGRNSQNYLYSIYYIKGLNYKIFGSVFFSFIYLYYYKGGDSINFYYAISPLYKMLPESLDSWTQFVFSLDGHYPYEAIYEADVNGVLFLLRGSATLTTIKIGAILDLLSFNSYIVLCLFFAFISYQFQWRVFKLFAGIYPSLHKELSVAFLTIPSVIFWGSAVSKDSIMLGAIMLFIYCFYNLVILKRGVIKYLLLLVICGYLITLIRSFILFTLVPCLLLMAITYYRNSINSSALRIIVGPVLLIVAVGVSVLFVQSLGSSVSSYDVESLQQKAEGFRSWHTTQGGSTYTIGDPETLDYTFTGVLRQTPVAIITTLFGPFVWQVRNIVMLLSAIESLAFLYFTASIFFNGRIYKLFNVLIQDHIVVFCVPFALILSVAIGLTSFNYGALVRYKIPILPFFATALILIRYHLNRSNTDNTI